MADTDQLQSKLNLTILTGLLIGPTHHSYNLPDMRPEDTKQEHNEHVDNQPERISLGPIQPFELLFKNLTVTAEVDEVIKDSNNKEKTVTITKRILNNCTGVFAPSIFTVIVGPSGCGKTTLLNLLSGRLLSTNLQLSGQLLVNGKSTNDINQHGEMIGYVMQQDLLYATFTPRETFKFIADMRLGSYSEEEKDLHVLNVIDSLGLQKCADTYVGNEVIRGVSGGEKKRTSIGVELLINPSIMFLDEPTTGLDSTTALNVIKTLNNLARSGRTIVATIHQPSSEIFSSFDRMIIMVQGNLVYQGPCQQSMNYFKQIGFPVPSRSNPTDFYMKIMNKEGVILDQIARGEEDIADEVVEKQFEERIGHFKKSYSQQNSSFLPGNNAHLVASQTQGQIPWCSQMYHIFVRALRNELRNPLDVQLKFVMFLIQSLFCVVLYYKEGGNAFSRMQNVAGALFFILLTVGFGGMNSSLTTFSMERPIFIRERMSNSYSTSAYFWGRSFATFPFELLFPLLTVVIAYFACHFNGDVGVFFWTILISELVFWHASSYGFFLSTLFSDPKVIMALVPILLIPLMLLGGFFISLDQVPKFFYFIEYISPFKFGFQALIQNEYRGPVDCGNGVYCDLLETKFKFTEPFWLNLLLLFLIGVAFRVAAWVSLYLISNPKKVVLESHVNTEEEPSNVNLMDVPVAL